MNSILETIKKGDSCHVLLTFEGVDADGDYVFRDKRCLDRLHFDADSVKAFVTPISYANRIKNTEPAPKYDPCRKFRKRDKVEVVANKGRKHIGCHGDVGTVIKDEDEMGQVTLKLERTGVMVINAAYLNLITPVEERELYSLDSDDLGWNVLNIDEWLVARFCNNGHPYAKKAAEAECARLNAEWKTAQRRKEKRAGQ